MLAKGEMILGAAHMEECTYAEDDSLDVERLPVQHHRAAAVYFTYKQKPMCFACDKWDQVHDNIYAIGKTIKALRGIIGLPVVGAGQTTVAQWILVEIIGERSTQE